MSLYPRQQCSSAVASIYLRLFKMWAGKNERVAAAYWDVREDRERVFDEPKSWRSVGIDHLRSGFSLIEVAIVLTILGIVAGYGVPAFLKYRQHQQLLTTQQNQEAVFFSLASYLVNNHQIPCPADPSDGDENFGVARLMCTAPAKKLIGIVPFRTLGLPEAMAKDGFGRYFTYAIDSEVRNETFGFEEDAASPGFEYYCSRKGGPGSRRLIIKNGSRGHSLFSLGFGGNEEREDDFALVVLVSHGPPGGGAYVKGGRKIPQGGMSSDEGINSDATLVFVDRPYSIQPENSFRQIVRWVSQKNLAAIYARFPCRARG